MSYAHKAQLSDAALVGERLKDCYQIEERAGKGGMAWVYRATHTMLQETFAVKILFSQHAAERELRERFLREAQLQSRVKHPNVIRVTDFINESGLVGLVQEWCEGGDLQEWLETQQRAMTKAELAALFLPIIEAVGAAHQHGIIHRDLKPANIMLMPQDSGLPIPKLADFGLAKKRDATSITAANSSMGTPLYMAPEQFVDAKEVDERADIYSLGVMLYQLCEGRLPYSGDLNSLVFQVFQGVPEPPSHAEGPLADVILKSMHKDPSSRYETCEALAAALRNVLHNLPTLSVPFTGGLPSGSQLPQVRDDREGPLPPRKRPPEEDNPAPTKGLSDEGRSQLSLLFVSLGLFVALGVGVFWYFHQRSKHIQQPKRTHQITKRTKAAKRAPPPPLKARQLLEAVSRSYGGRKAFHTIKKTFSRGRLSHNAKGVLQSFTFELMSQFPNNQRIVLRNHQLRIIAVLSPRISQQSTNGVVANLHPDKAKRIPILHAFKTMEFTPPKLLKSIVLRRPSWLNATKVQKLALTDKAGRQVVLSIDNRYRILRRSYLWEKTRFSHFYTQHRWFRILGTKHNFTWPMLERIYKNGILHNRIQLTFLQLNAPSVRESHFAPLR